MLVEAVLIYFHHNTTALAIMELSVADLISINNSFFRVFTSIQCWIGFVLTVIIGPSLISRDLANNALPLYLCRPISRAEYIIGKISVIAFMLSAITWVPGLLMFFFQSFLGGFGWLTSNLWMAGSIFLYSLTWIILLALLSTALSALIKWKLAAGGAIFASFIATLPMAGIIVGMFRAVNGFVISPTFVMYRIGEGFFGVETDLTIRDAPLPVFSAWVVYLLICGICLLILTRKVRAYEVIK
ncbi:MAG TPA: hypothetical protein VFD58_18515 [Blastocatellia bacterium]|nr:hypothetical protein [Blastocatellia bacterium]